MGIAMMVRIRICNRHVPGVISNVRCISRNMRTRHCHVLINGRARVIMSRIWICPCDASINVRFCCRDISNGRIVRRY